MRNAAWALLACALSLGCGGTPPDNAAPGLAKCQALEAQGHFVEALDACSAAYNANNLSKSGVAAHAKLADLRVALDRKLNAEEKATAVANAKAAAEAEAERIRVGGWKTIPLPGDVPAERLRYMTDVGTRQPGEPPLKRREATAWMQRFRAEIAKASGVPLGAVTVKIGTESGSVHIDRDALMGNEGQAISAGACSEPYMGIAVMGAGMEEAAKAALPSVLCISEGCTASFDLRPTRPQGGGMYGGPRCVSFAQVLEMAGLR